MLVLLSICMHFEASWVPLGGILVQLGSILRDLEGSWRLPGAIWAILEADIAKKKTQKKNAGPAEGGGLL